MPGIADELRKFNYGKDLAESLATVGKVIGENKRRQQAQEQVSEYVNKAFKAGNSLQDLVSNPELSNLIGSINSTKEGQQAWNAFQESIGLKGKLEGQARANLLEVGPGKKIISTQTDAKGNITPGKPVLEEPPLPKVRTSTVMPEDYTKYGIDPKTLEHTVTGPGGAKNIVRDTVEIARDIQTGEPIMGSDGKPFLSIKRLEGQTIPNTPQGGMGAEVKDVPTNLDWTKTGEDFINQFPPVHRNNIRGLAEGTLSTRDLFSMARSAQSRELYSAAARQFKANDPSAKTSGFTTQEYQSQLKALSSFAPGGNDGKAITSLNQATGHLGVLQQVGERLNNKPSDWWNAVENFGKNRSGAPEVKEFQDNATFLIEELAKAFGGKPGTIPELAKIEKSISAINSPAAMKGVFNNLMDLLSTRYATEANQWVSRVKRPVSDLNLVYPESQEVFTRLGRKDLLDKINNLGASLQPATDDGKEDTRTIGGKTYVKKNGKWFERTTR